ncbi:MAG: hypothetical protein GF381_00480 [Candidatus Pacebacteria bacterium]|nr:hypothetical protein [Candidatus Paceibacterota bacterium]
MANFLTNLNRKIGLDLGSARTRMWVQGEGLLINEASLVALDTQNQKLIAVGDQANSMSGRAGEGIEVRPLLKRGQLQDDELLESFLKILLQRISDKAAFISPSIMVSLPTNLTPAKKQATVQVLYQLGAREVYTVSQPLAAAIGSGVPTADASGCFLLQLGQGVVEAAAISLGKVVVSKTSFQAGHFLSRDIGYWLKKSQQLEVSQEVVEQIKTRILSLDQERNLSLAIVGVGLTKRDPQEIKLNSSQLRSLAEQSADHWGGLVRQLLSQVPPALTADVLDKGILLSGGLAQLDGLASHLTQLLQLPVSLVENPDQAVVDGTATILEHLSEFKKSLAYEA